VILPSILLSIFKTIQYDMRCNMFVRFGVMVSTPGHSYDYQFKFISNMHICFYMFLYSGTSPMRSGALFESCEFVGAAIIVTVMPLLGCHKE